MTEQQRTFDRIAVFDERSRNYPIRTVIESDVFRTKDWECNTWNDQGSEGACVGFAWSHELSATPAVVPTNNTIAYALYKRAQQLDVWEGEAYSGTSVLGGAKAVSELTNADGEKYISEYRWAFGLADTLLAIAHTGPVVIGVNWYEGMFRPDAHGFLRATGRLQGGHAVLLVATTIVSTEPDPTRVDQLDLDASYVTIHNSWGRGWGDVGRAKLTLRDLQRLLAENGDVCVPMVRGIDNVVVPTDDDVVVPTPEPVAPAPVEPSEPEEPHTPGPIEPTPEPVVPEPTPEPVEPRKPKKSGNYFSVRRSNLFHDSHAGLRPWKWYDTFEEARRDGLRPCYVCRPQ